MATVIDEQQQWFDEDTGALIVNGNVYIGTAGLDPTVGANQLSLYSDRDLTVAITNPQTTGSDGRTTNKIWFDEDKYSITVTDSDDVEKYTELDNGFGDLVGNVQTENSLGVNDITATGVVTQTEYIDNTSYIVTAPADNTGAMTVNIDSIGQVDIRKAHDQALDAGDVLEDMKLFMVYNSTDGWMELQTNVANTPSSGTFSPELWDTSLDGNEGQTYSVQTGTYTVIGNRVWFDIEMTVTSLGSLTTSSPAVVGNLPFTSSATNQSAVTVGKASGLNITANQTVAAYIDSSDDYVALHLWDQASGSGSLLVSEFSATGSIVLSGTFTT